MPPKATRKQKDKPIARATKTPAHLRTFQRILDTMRKDPKYKNKSYAELQQLASKMYKKL